MVCPRIWRTLLCMTKKLFDFLNKNKGYFRINAIEAKTDIPQSTISKALRRVNGRTLTDAQENKVDGYLLELKDELQKYLQKKFGGLN